MHLATPFLLLSTTTTLASTRTPLSPTSSNSSTTCTTASLASFIPPHLPPPAATFQHYLQQPVCSAPPTLTGLVARNRFEEDYERFAKYFNTNYSQVPTACRKRFKKATKKGRIPRRYDDYVRKEEKKCGKKVGKVGPGEGYPNGGKGKKGQGSGAQGLLGGAMPYVAQGVIVGVPWGNFELGETAEAKQVIEEYFI
ncbi:hypothetical protein P171DRAFT_486380 [Karstenula rhodostoma CBS 690.94]|uniref:Uncharacterized protein n=1 Tax=Karstenula rhodostoma CBS 690.94 TaxID=1392251 RepID=A0A9P4PI99_9PLEO|nr:hypothetical protein P171DRAFT_486380 [Karstenula rhodostoma CBS 690.94]